METTPLDDSSKRRYHSFFKLEYFEDPRYRNSSLTSIRIVLINVSKVRPRFQYLGNRLFVAIKNLLQLSTTNVLYTLHLSEEQFLRLR